MAKMTLGPKEVCQKAEISARQLNYWKLIGVVRPRQEVHGRKVFYRYTEKDLEMILAVRRLTREGYMVSKAAEKIKAAVARGEEILPQAPEDLIPLTGPGSDEKSPLLTPFGETFKKRLEEEIQRSHRFGYSLSCLAFTLDWDSDPGPRALPVFLSEIESLLLPLKRTFDVVTRVDDRTFIWLLCQTERPGAESVSRRIQESLSGFEGRHNGLLYVVKTWIGISNLKDREGPGATLVQRALEKVKIRRNFND